MTEGTIQITDDSVIITRHQVSESAVLASARRAQQGNGGDLAVWLDRLLLAGAQMEAVAGPSVDLAAHQSAIARLEDRMAKGVVWFNAELTRALAGTVGPSGTVPTAIAAQLQQLESQLQGVLGGEDGMLREAVGRELEAAGRAITATVTQGLASQTQMVNKLLSADGTGPLAAIVTQHRTGTEEVLAHLRRLDGEVKAIAVSAAVAAATAAERRKSSAHGLEFEERVREQLDVFARATGDWIEETGTSTGVTGRKGDFLLTCHEDAREAIVVVEAKDRAKAISERAWVKEAEAALQNRSGVGYLAVVPTAAGVPGSGGLCMPKAGIVIVSAEHPELLAAALRLCRVQAIAAVTAPSANADVVAAEIAIRHARDAITRVETILRGAQTIRTSAAAIEKATNELRDELSRHLTAALTHLGGDKTPHTTDNAAAA